MSDDKNPMREFSDRFEDPDLRARSARFQAKMIHFGLLPWESREPRRIPVDFAEDMRAEQNRHITILHARLPCDHQGVPESRSMVLHRSTTVLGSDVHRIRPGDRLVWCAQCGHTLRHEPAEDVCDPYARAHINKVISLAAAYAREIQKTPISQGFADHPVTIRVVRDDKGRYCAFPESEAIFATSSIKEATGVLSGAWDKKYDDLAGLQKAFRDGARNLVKLVEADQANLDKLRKGLDFILGPESR